MLNNSDFKYMYKNRQEAYEELFRLIPKNLVYDSDWKIITNTLNNLKEVCKISQDLKLDCEPFFLQEITAPNNSECTIAVVSELKEIVIEKNLVKSFEIDEDYIYKKSQELYENNILTKLYAFKGGKVLDNIKDKKIMIFSDGCDIGLNILCVVKSLLNNGAKKIFVFMPIISQDLYYSLDMIVDEIFVNRKIADFIRTSYYYENFEELNIDKIRYILEKRRKFE